MVVGSTRTIIGGALYGGVIILDLTDRERIMLRTMILTRQLGNASGTLGFLMRTDNENVLKALREHLKCDLGDLLLQVEMLIKDLKFDIKQVKQLAYDRYDECKDEFKRNGKSQYFI